MVIWFTRTNRAKNDKYHFMANLSEVVRPFIHFCFNSFSVFFNEFQFVLIEDSIRWNLVVNINALKRIFCTYLHYHIVHLSIPTVGFSLGITIYLLIHMYTNKNNIEHTYTAVAFGYIICFPFRCYELSVVWICWITTKFTTIKSVALSLSLSLSICVCVCRNFK